MSKKKIKVESRLSKFSRYYEVTFLSAIAVVTLLLRTLYPFKVVFGSDFTNFLETDAWNRMMYAKSMAGMGLWDSITYMVQNNLLFSWLVSVFGRVIDIELVGAWMPPLMMVGVVVVVFFIGRALFDRNVGLISALFVAVIPSELLHRSLLGFTDHHALEALLMALAVFFLIRAVQTEKVFSKWSALTGVTLLFYFLNWRSGLYMMGILAIAMMAVMAFFKPRWKYPAVVAVAFLIGLVLYLPIGGWQQFLFLIPGQEAQQAAINSGEMITTITASPSQRTISELMPMLWPHGKFSLSVVISNLHLFTFTFLAGFWFIWKQRQNKAIVLFTVWTVVMLAMAINERRFLYYLTLNVGILSAFCIFELAAKLRGKVLQNAVILSLPLIIVSLPLAKGVTATTPYLMTQEWHDSLVWLKEQPDEGKVSCWGDYGHWVVYVAEKTPNYLPGPGGDTLAKAYLSKTDDEALKYLEQLDTGYLIVDEFMVRRKYQALQIYSGMDTPPVESLAYRLYYSSACPDYLVLAYQEAGIKIFRYRG